MSYNPHGIGVAGDYGGTKRSVMDQQMQKEFGHPGQAGPVKEYPGSPIGVMGQYGPERSVMDKRLQNEFGGLNRENFQYRTQHDQRMQQKFNPWYGENKEDYAGQNHWRPIAPENNPDCGCGSCPNCNCMLKGVSASMHNPYNPYSYSATYVPLS